jgi:alkylation response protein AidB-like acyl-CoA dehydrogenase
MTAVDATELRDELRSVARSMLTKLRVTADERRAWQVMADAGWLGLDVPDALGGSGATFAEVAVVLEEMGRVPLPTPYLGTAVLGIGLLGLVEAGAERDELLRGAAAGEVRLAVAMAADVVAGGAAPVEQFCLEPTGAGVRLVGHAPFVLGAAAADRILVPAREPDGGRVVLALDPSAAGLRVDARPLVDATRSVASVTADGLALRDAAVATWRFAGDADESLRRLLDRAAVAVACDSLGLSEAMLEATVSYATVRHQFGRPIGSFQAVKHACADMLVSVSLARELVSAAARAVADGDRDASTVASMAKSHACGAAVDVVGKALQLHGGIGYTWESDVHVYLKRAVLDRSLFGSPSAHRRRLAGAYRCEGPEADTP